MTLTEFLLDRIAEDEAVARDAFDDLNLDGEGTGWSTSRGYEHNHLSAPGYVFTRRCSPERVLAECEAKRRIVEMGEAIEQQSPDRGRRDVAGVTLRLLALPFADHPDYREEWKP